MSEGSRMLGHMRLPRRLIGGVAGLASTFILVMSGATVAAAMAQATGTPARSTVAATESRAAQTPTPAVPNRSAAPSRQVVLQAQRLFRLLGYPLGGDRAGELGVGTKGALEYFQRKYGLAATGYPSRPTLTLMAAVAALLHEGSPSTPAPSAVVPAVAAPPPRGSYSAHAQPRDLVERLLGDDLPYLTIAIALAIVLALLALSARRAPGYASAKTRGSAVDAAGKS